MKHSEIIGLFCLCLYSCDSSSEHREALGSQAEDHHAKPRILPAEGSGAVGGDSRTDKLILVETTLGDLEQWRELLLAGKELSEEERRVVFRIMDQESLDKCVELLDEMPVGGLRSSLLRRFAERYARVDIIGASNWLMSLEEAPENRTAFSAVARAAAGDHALAESALREIQNPSLRRKYFLSFLAETAKTDFEGAMTMLESEKWRGLQGDASSSEIVASIGTSISPSEMAQNLPDLLKFSASVSASESLLAGSLEHSLRQMDASSLGGLVEELSEKRNLSEGGEIVAKVAEVWTMKEPISVSKWLASIPPSTSRDYAIAGFAREVAENEPRSAAEWLVTIGDANLRNKALRDLLIHASVGRDEIEEVIGKSDLLLSEKDAVLSGAANK